MPETQPSQSPPQSDLLLRLPQQVGKIESGRVERLGHLGTSTTCGEILYAWISLTFDDNAPVGADKACRVFYQ